MRKTAAVAIPGVGLLVSLAAVAGLIAANAFESGSSGGLFPVVGIWLFVCAAAVSGTAVCFLTKNAVTVSSAVCIAAALVIIAVIITNIDLENRMQMGLVVIVNTAKTRLSGILFWCAAFAAAVGAVVFTGSLFIKKGRKNYENAG